MALVNPLQQLRSFTAWVEQAQHRTARVYDALYTTHNREALEHLMVYLAAVGFLLHLFIIFLARSVPALSPLSVVVGTNFLSAIYTPFSFILFYEVLLMVLAIPESTTRAVGTQFEIISLIILRNVFKDLAEFESLEHIEQQFDAFLAILLDMSGGLVLFLLVTVFYHISRRTAQAQAMQIATPALDQFVARKKVVALFLSGLLFVLAAGSLISWWQEGYQAILTGVAPGRTPTASFYTDLFTVLIFADVLLLILSLLLTNNYQMVVRNAGFVIATILMRISLSADKPYDVGIAITAALFGILVLLIYKYSSQIKATHELHRPGEY